jgi:hypothetical protein
VLGYSCHQQAGHKATTKRPLRAKQSDARASGYLPAAASSRTELSTRSRRPDPAAWHSRESGQPKKQIQPSKQYAPRRGSGTYGFPITSARPVGHTLGLDGDEISWCAVSNDRAGRRPPFFVSLISLRSSKSKASIKSVGLIDALIHMTR